MKLVESFTYLGQEVRIEPPIPMPDDTEVTLGSIAWYGSIAYDPAYDSSDYYKEQVVDYGISALNRGIPDSAPQDVAHVLRRLDTATHNHNIVAI